ncbi:sodium:proton antiporter [Novosphingobium silvae]|uniref:sodium:proton antiporter n=1 Tax=Novosphingobium silvae TaxID=2692619 RepID=UPI001F3A9C18|nr:sodium:proton antiporter [Novosphingobium silvae]
MSLVYALVGAGIVACALFMILSRNLVRMLLGFSMLATGANLLLFLAGGPVTDQPPIIAEDASTLAASADPVVQALILTAIVIGFALTVVIGVLVLRAWKARKTIDAREINDAEALGQPRRNDPADG